MRVTLVWLWPRICASRSRSGHRSRKWETVYICNACDGTGEAGRFGTRRCRPCRGTGEVQNHERDDFDYSDAADAARGSDMDECFITQAEAARIFKDHMAEAERLQDEANAKLKLTVVRAVRQAYEDGYDAGFGKGCTRAFENLTPRELELLIAAAQNQLAVKSRAA